MERPEPLNENVTKSMKSNKRKDTSPELKMRRALREAGYPGYRLQWKIPGRPDITYPGRKVAVFVNGCFWHRCPRCNLNIPRHNRDYWIDKFEKNVDRDRRNQERLIADGWDSIVIWECEIDEDIQSCVGRVVESLRSFDEKRGRTASESPDE